MFKISTFSVAATALQLFCAIGFAQQDPTDKLEKVLAEICREKKVPALAVAVVRPNEIVATACSGIRKLGANSAVELSDRFPLGSNTKSMTATLAAILVEAGEIEWTTTVSEVWSTAGEKHLHPSLRDVTLEELLSHQSGLQSDLGGKDWIGFFDEENSPTRERQRMLKLIMKKKPKHAHRKFTYSNLGYVVAAAMLEKQTGESYEALMHQKVFKPLKMESADFRTMTTAKNLKEPLLWGHTGDKQQPMDPRIAGAENPSVYAPCGTVNVTIEDYAKYAQWHLREEPAPLLSDRKTLDRIHSGIVDAPSIGGKYGGGWIHLDMGFGRVMNHVGSNTNSFAVIWVFPDSDFAAIACTNTGAQSGFLACDKAIEHLMKTYMTDQ